MHGAQRIKSYEPPAKILGGIFLLRNGGIIEADYSEKYLLLPDCIKEEQR